MSQQCLLFPSLKTPHHHSWVHHQGTHTACSRLAIWLNNGGLLWLRSSSPAGKSHLLDALQEEYPQQLIKLSIQADLAPLDQVSAWLSNINQHTFWCIDLAAKQLSQNTSTALFHLIERSKAMSCALLISWRCENLEQLLPELSSRMHMIEQVTIQPPQSDYDLHAVLKAAAQQLHWDIPESFIKVMLTHLPRDLESQLSALKTLEHASQKEQRRMTQLWAKHILNL